MNEKLAIDKDRIAAFCRGHHITRLAIFGSALRDDFAPDSVLDMPATSQVNRLTAFLLLRISREAAEFLSYISR